MLTRIQSPLLALVAMLSLGLPVGAQADQGLRLDPEQTQSWKARVNLVAADGANGSRLLGAQLLGDFYLLDNSGVRLSGGLMLGPTSLLGTGLAPAAGSVRLGVSQRSLHGSTDEQALHQPYLGVGYSLSNSKAGWGFSADLGVAVSGNANGLRLSSSTAFAQSLDESVRRLQWTPLLQVGLSYRF